MRVATLNLNGATIKTINRRPRLPEELFNIKVIKEKLIERTIQGLEKILEKKDIDIIAIQELINSQAEKNMLKDIIEGKGYRLIAPEISGYTHFTVAFIVNEDSITIENISRDEELKVLLPNRVAILDFKIDGESYSIINLHVNNHNISIPNVEGNVILLGDMNAFTYKQSADNKEVNKEFLDKITSENYMELGKDTDYTWKNSELQRKLDHIFISEKLAESVDAIKYSSVVTKDDSVNFYYDKKEGFTDHSMLILDLEL